MISHTRALTLLVAFVLTTLTATSHAVENTWDYSVQVSSSLQSSPAQITLSWPQDTNGVPSSYTVYRRASGSTDWGQGKTLAGSATSYVDADVKAGQAYEYRIVKAGSSYTGYGYILTAIEAPLVDSRGKLVLVVDNTVAAPLATELSRLERDLVGDGWEVIRRDVGRNDSVANVKAVIKAAYDTDPANVKSVFLFGHVPVPYSGNFNPDGHTDHVGAWPADAFYGDINGNWTDNSVNFTQTLNTDKADAERMSNRPGDGKFDQTTLPSAVELQVGRVDLSNLPGRTTWGGPATFASEIELLRKYLEKDHSFRHRKTNPERRAILGDYFGQRGGEAFAASGFRSFAPLVGADKIRNLNKEFNDQRGVWIKEASAQDYLLAYGCGAGSYATIAGLGNTGIYNDGATTEMVQNDVRGVFNLLFGSWLGDWDHEDNILRAPLATSQGLVSVWSGRPHWYIHSMGLGETIGHSARLTMNNTGDYQTQINSAQNRVHIALMGDPTLRLHPVVPVGNINGTVNGSAIALTWGASADTAIVGYHVYRSDGGAFVRLTALPTKDLSYTDANGSAAATYMVRAIKLESTTSGSYHNASQGVFWSVASGSTGGSEIVVTTPPANNTGSNTGTTTTPPTDTTTPSTPPTTAPAAVSSDDVVWFDDALPLGAGGGATGGDTWNWVAANPAPFSGTVSHQSNIASGIHDHYFNWAGQTMAVAAGDKLFAYVYIDPANVPSQIMISWCSNNWEHRAYWGDDKINTGTNGTASRFRVGAMPAAGEWVRLEVPASAVGLEGQAVQGMSFSLFGGRVSWDRIGRSPTAAPSEPSPAPAPAVAETIWFDDAVPAGGGTGTSGGDTWNWVASNPAPVSGSKAHQSSVGTGLREHWFNWASPMKVSAGDVIFTYVYIDPANKPAEIMLSFVSDNWEHRAYWGENKINSGTNGTASRRYVGPMPAAGQWVRLEVSAKDIGLEGHNVAGMSFGTFDGRATYDKTGRASASTSTGGGTTSPATGANTVTLTATDATATIGNDADTATLTFTRTGSTASALKVKFDLGGSAVKWIDYRRPEGDMPVDVTIPAGSASATIKIRAVANVTNANPATVSFTLASDAAYTIGTAKSAAITLAPAGSSNGGGTTTPPTTTPPTTTPPTTTPPTTTPPTQVPVEAVNENAIARLPEVGDHRLRIISPTILELNRINTKEADPAAPTSWNFVSGGNFNAPATSEFTVTVNGSAVSVKSVGFRRRVAYAQLNQRDLRIDNSLFLELSSNIPEGATVEVKNPSAGLWPATFVFKGAASATRFNPAIHVNQEGYVPSFPKKALIGYYLGNKGELEVNAAAGFYLVDARTGKVVHSGGLATRKETGYIYNQLPYQKVLEADFSSFTTPGEYQVVVPGHGASLPFLINEGIAMNFTRTYAQGLYHQRCGAECKMPYTRHVHGACHVTQAEIPSPQSDHAFTYRVITERNGDAKSEPRHTAPRIVDEASLLYPFINKGKIDVSLGHHDAGDYSKYMTNSAALAHLLMFTAENINGARNLDNLGLPESGDGISDLMQEAKHEADYIAKMQDADGGFYFLVYPKNRSYESDVTPDKGDTQVVWPKNTAATGAATAALAQLGSSPMFKAAYPAAAADYLAKAKKGWEFLTNAIAKYGKDGSYQKMTHYGHNFLHDDEIAWAAAELFLATGDEQYHRALKEWFPNPSDPATFRWGWWRLCESYGNAIRSYAFAARSGRIAASQLDAAYLAKCEEQIKLAGDDAVKWSTQSAYANSFPEATKHVKGAAWFFSLDQAADAAVAFQLDPKAEYTKALVGNMDYEGGSNPVNVPYLTGIGMKRQREIVHQWANNDNRGLPMNGIPQGNVQASYDMLWHYSASGNELQKLSFPTDDISSTTTYPFYDRWADTWNVTTEFVVVNQARGLMAVAALATQTSAKNTAWKPTTTATINVPAGTSATGAPVTLSLKTDGIDMAGARILWEARDQQADFGSTYTISPKNGGDQWVDAEITWPDGRRMYATNSFRANAALVNWVDDALPVGAQGSGSESWNWVSSPTAKLGSLAHQSSLASGLHEHAFQYALVPLEISAGDTMFVWVYLDPANMPEQVMISWNDGSWEHRAYWGADKIQYGTNGTASRFRGGDLPVGGQWVKLEVPAKAVGLEGSKISGMSFSAFGGRVTWDATGKTSPVN